MRQIFSFYMQDLIYSTGFQQAGGSIALFVLHLQTWGFFKCGKISLVNNTTPTVSTV